LAESYDQQIEKVQANPHLILPLVIGHTLSSPPFRAHGLGGLIQSSMIGMECNFCARSWCQKARLRCRPHRMELMSTTS
jgi:hypothetical protein